MIAQKVRTLVVAADALTMSDIPAARRLFAEWPTPVVVATSDIGDAAQRFQQRIEQRGRAFTIQRLLFGERCELLPRLVTDVFHHPGARRGGGCG